MQYLWIDKEGDGIANKLLTVHNEDEGLQRSLAVTESRDPNLGPTLI